MPAGYAGTITLTNTEDTAIGYAAAGGPALLLARMDPASKARFTLFLATPRMPSMSFLTIRHGSALTYTGTFTPYQGDYTLNRGRTVVYDAVIADAGATPGHLDCHRANGSGMTLSATTPSPAARRSTAPTVMLAYANAPACRTPGVPDIDLSHGAVLRLTAKRWT